MKVKKSNDRLALTIKSIVGKMADISCGAASCWGIYQPKEPKAHKVIKNKNK